MKEQPNSTSSVHLNVLQETYIQQREILRAFLINRLRSPDDADDVLQDLYLKLGASDKQETILNPTAFLFTMTSNLATDFIRSRQRSRRILQHDYRHVRDVTDVDASADSVVWSREWVDSFKAVVLKLPQKQRRVFLMHKLANKSHREIADELQISIKTVEKHMAKAMTFCRSKLKRFLK